MNMRGSRRARRQATAVLPASFQWDRALIATLTHTSIPLGESVQVTPLAEAAGAGARDRLSLVAQLAAHEAFLQFAGLTDTALDPAEWGVVAKRGADVRLIRIASGSSDASSAPPVLSIVQELAELLGVELEVLRQPWARADAIYAEAFARLDRDVAADQTWVRAAACGAISSPGPAGLRALLEPGSRGTWSDPACLQSLRRFAESERTFRLVVVRGLSPLQPYSALGTLASETDALPAVVAERIVAKTSGTSTLFVVVDEESVDPPSRRVIEILSGARHGSWLFPSDSGDIGATRPFLIAPRLAARDEVAAPWDAFVQSAAFAAYLSDGEVPKAAATLPSLVEPARSFVGALALLGSEMTREAAQGFLSQFLFTGELESLAVDGVLGVEKDVLRFASESAREEAARLIPASSRPAISRIAAAHASGVNAALLWLDAGEPGAARAVLENAEYGSAHETAEAFHRVPRMLLTPALLRRYAFALIECGRYRDACELAPGDDLVLARAERRMGDYATALRRVERLEPSFDVLLLRAEVCRLLDRAREALEILDTCTPEGDAQRCRLHYERGLHGLDVRLPDDHYLSARLATYRALERNDYDAAREGALRARSRATSVIEQIDASLDLVFTVFSAGQWDEARVAAVEALREVEETQGDRAAGGIVYTLAYLAADDGQWAHAAQRITRLRQYYSSTGDALRLAELRLLTAHLDFCRGRFADARADAELVFERRDHHDQIREAAALILDEVDWIEHKPLSPRSTGRSGNAELSRRRERLLAGEAPVPDARRTSDRLYAFRHAVANGDEGTARTIAAVLDLFFEPAPPAADVEARVLRAAATRDYPFSPHDFDLPWCHAVRNRLGHWSVIGSFRPPAEVFDTPARPAGWIAVGERELLYFQGCEQWTSAARDAVAALFTLRSENHRFKRLLEQEENASSAARTAIDGIVGQSAEVRKVEALVERVARRDVPVCILGESGTGKELVARAIHRQSSRRQKPFTAVNCAALPENLVESELFGHVRGAFTGADRDRAGLIETSEGGTLFLDEIGELPLPAQAKLLRFLQEGEFRRVGDTAARTADVRIVSATNRKLDQAVEEGRFRDDLYYRVRGVEVSLPPLRERGGDIPLLASHFLAVERQRHRSGPALLSRDVEDVLCAYRWPGNVRELQNTIRAAHAMAGDAREIRLEHLADRMRNVVPREAPAGSYQHAVMRFKRDLIERSLADANGNQNRAAAMLKMSRQALAYQIRELGIMVRK